MNPTAETLSALAGLALSLAASYLPGFAPWFQSLDGQRKRLVMLALLSGATLVTYLVALWQGQPVDPLSLARAFFSALVANQAAYLISPQILPAREES